jgi:hypothetical protein
MEERFLRIEREIARVSLSTTEVGSFQRSAEALRLQPHLLVRGLTTPPSHASH